MTAITHWELKQMQSLPLHLKIHKTCARIQEWHDYHDGGISVSFSGGIDSTVLLDIARKLYPDIPAVFSNTGLEMPEIVQFVRTFDNVEEVRPEHSFKWVLENRGYPVVSKLTARMIRSCQHKTDKNAISTNRYMTGINAKGELKSTLVIPKRWTPLIDSKFKISEECCYYIKKQPMRKYSKETGRATITAEMAIDSRLRRSTYMTTGCNNYTGKHPKSMPMGFWTRQDVLSYIKVFNLPYCSVYGDIIYDPVKDSLETTLEQRTGCMFCMFGVHMEKHPNRFERMKISHPKHYAVCMNLGCGEVMDYIGVRH
jgi:3'-phosphoadenosine 5'-phosphosulfate sulfotransferase (PAPS reductase)/FAD synthetase